MSSKFQENGFTLIESIIGIALMLVVFLGIFGVYQLGFKVLAQSKARISATALANQKIELAHNLAYGDIGTVSGIPTGTIRDSEVINRNRIAYTVRTTVAYIDDSFDGVAPVDSLPNDYKRIKVQVSWDERYSGEVVLMADISPKGLETSVGGGNLLIRVFDALGIGIPQADIHVVNNDVVPAIDVNYQADNNGEYLVAGAPASSDGYQITVSESGHSIDRTYGVDEIINPEKPHATVIAGELTQASFSIDLLSSFSVDTVFDSTSIPVPNTPFSIRGDKIIGTDISEDSIYKYSADLVSDGSGNLNIPNLEWDSYTFSVDSDATGLTLVGTTPTPQPVGLVPNSPQNVTLFLSSENNLLAQVQDAETGLPIFSASVRIFNVGLGYDEVQLTNNDGETLFIPLEGDSYEWEVSVGGYISDSGGVLVSGNTTEVINLIPGEI